MMRKLRTAILAGVAALAFILAGCSNVFGPAPGSSASSGYGSVKLALALEGAGGQDIPLTPNYAAKTIYPTVPTAQEFVEYYVAFFESWVDTTDIDYDALVEEWNFPAADLAAQQFTLPTGDYKILVAVFTSQGPAAEGWYKGANGSDIYTLNETANPAIAVKLAPVRVVYEYNLSGTISWDITWPEGKILVFLGDYDNGLNVAYDYDEDDYIYGDSGTAEGSLDEPPVPAGYYLINALLYDPLTGYTAGKADVVHVYSGLDTKVVWTFTEDDFTGTYVPPNSFVVDGRTPKTIRTAAYSEVPGSYMFVLSPLVISNWVDEPDEYIQIIIDSANFGETISLAPSGGSVGHESPSAQFFYLDKNSGFLFDLDDIQGGALRIDQTSEGVYAITFNVIGPEDFIISGNYSGTFTFIDFSGGDIPEVKESTLIVYNIPSEADGLYVLVGPKDEPTILASFVAGANDFSDFPNLILSQIQDGKVEVPLWNIGPGFTPNGFYVGDDLLDFNVLVFTNDQFAYGTDDLDAAWTNVEFIDVQFTNGGAVVDFYDGSSSVQTPDLEGFLNDVNSAENFSAVRALLTEDYLEQFYPGLWGYVTSGGGPAVDWDAVAQALLDGIIWRSEDDLDTAFMSAVFGGGIIGPGGGDAGQFLADINGAVSADEVKEALLYWWPIFFFDQFDAINAGLGSDGWDAVALTVYNGGIYNNFQNLLDAVFGAISNELGGDGGHGDTGGGVINPPPPGDGGGTGDGGTGGAVVPPPPDDGGTGRG